MPDMVRPCKVEVTLYDAIYRQGFPNGTELKYKFEAQGERKDVGDELRNYLDLIMGIQPHGK